MKLNNKLYKIISAVFWIGVWYVVALIANINLMIKIPYPHTTLRALWGYLGKWDFYYSVIQSYIHITLGFIFAVILGTVGGLLSYKIKLWRITFDPLIRLIRTVPVAVLVIIAWLWIPSNILPIIISCIMVYPIIRANVYSAAVGFDTDYITLARLNGLDGEKTFFGIIWPMVSDILRPGFLTALGIAWKSGIASEIICNPSGTLGALLQRSKASVDYDRVFAVTVVIVFMCVLSEIILKLLWKGTKEDD